MQVDIFSSLFFIIALNIINSKGLIAIYKKGSSAPTFLKIHLDKKHKTQTFKLNDAAEKLEIDPKNVLLCESSMMEMK